MRPAEFRIRRQALDAVIAHARAAVPAECCGMLVGSGRSIADAVPARNSASGTSRFLIEPRDHIAARRDARRRGLEVVGFYHSHPRSSPRPSESDIREAMYPEAVHLIVSLAGTEPAIGLFRIADGDTADVAFGLVG